MKTSWLLLVAMLSAPVLAQYKCVINGKTVYADAPCARDAQPVGALQDNVSSDQQLQRLKQSLKEERQRSAIERQQGSEVRARERSVERFTANEQAQAQANEAARRQRCANLESSMRYNQRSVALAQDVGWQRTLTQHENELKQRRESYDRDCR
jgi:hypothetical protein